MIERKEYIKDEAFNKEILSNGNVEYYDENKICKFECINKHFRKKIGNYKCFDINCKNILFL